MADFDSKYIGEPGNLKAIEYLEKMYASFGYKPEVQWFTTSVGGADPGPKTANVVATLRGTANPELIYVVSSHFDSVRGGPGADDNTSGTCALLEAARVLARTPLPATVVFASFTGEEAGLLGSREFVRLAKERSWQVAGALNNDMIGWSADGARHRQHHPLLERGHPRHPARRGVPVQRPRALRRALLPRHRRSRVQRRVGRHRRRHRVLPDPGEPELPPGLRTCSRRSTSARWPRRPRSRRRRSSHWRRARHG